LKTCAVRKIFVQSTHDEYGPRVELERVFEACSKPKEIHWIDAADHFFRDGLEALEETVFRLADPLSR
jgi:hypothetical protein